MSVGVAYLFMIVALIAGATKGHASRKTGLMVSTVSNISIMHCLRMFFCIIIGFFLVLIMSKGWNGFVLDNTSALICAFSGLATAFFVISWVICVRKSAYAMLNVFLVLSTLMPILISHFIWGEEIRTFKIIGFCILFIAVALMCIYNQKIKGKFTIKDVVMLSICAIFNGACSVAQKWRFYEKPDVLSPTTFNFYTYVIAFIVLALVVAFTKCTEKQKEVFPLKKVFWWILLLSVCLFTNSLCYTYAASVLSSSILYPLSNGCGLVIALLLGHFVYGEKINLYSAIGITLALISFVFMVI